MVPATVDDSKVGDTQVNLIKVCISCLLGILLGAAADYIARKS